MRNLTKALKYINRIKRETLKIHSDEKKKSAKKAAFS